MQTACWREAENGKREKQAGEIVDEKNGSVRAERREIRETRESARNESADEQGVTERQTQPRD